MKLIIALCLFGFALALPTEEPPVALNYHEAYGIKAAALIKAAEESTDFDGSRIVGGSSASLGQFPFAGGLVITLVTGQTSVCGSTLLSNTRAVTAAHCWFDGQNQALYYIVVLGSTTLFFGGTRLVTADVVMHPEWNPTIVLNDVAIITLPWVDFNDNIGPIALASGSDLFDGTWANATGFGIQIDGTGITTYQTLHGVSLQVITNAECAQTYQSFITDSHLCTSGAGGHSTCSGDSGGPLEAKVGGIRTLVGIFSFGHIDGCGVGHPAAFSRVSSFFDWISARL